MQPWESPHQNACPAGPYGAGKQKQPQPTTFSTSKARSKVRKTLDTTQCPLLPGFDSSPGWLPRSVPAPRGPHRSRLDTFSMVQPVRAVHRLWTTQTAPGVRLRLIGVERTGKAFVVKSAPTNHRSGLAPNRVTRFPPLWERRFAPSMIFFNHQSRGICDAGASKACRYPCSVAFLSAHAKTAQDIRSVHMSRSPIDGDHFVPRVDCV
jgi:hypothetical protein